MGKSSSTLKVADIMTPQSKLMTMSPYSSVLEAMALMMDKNIRHVPVVGFYWACALCWALAQHCIP